MSRIGRLDVLPGSVRELLVERLVEDPPARERNVRGVEEVERHLLRLVDQRVAELEPLLVQVTENRVSFRRGSQFV